MFEFRRRSRRPGQLYDASLDKQLMMLRFQSYLAATPRRWSDSLPGGQDRFWHRLLSQVASFGHPRTAAALEAHASGAALDLEALKLVSVILARTGDHQQYEDTLRRFDPGVAFPFQGEKVFMGRGGGGGSLNVFRKLGVGADARFEKIYVRKHAGHARMRFALETVLARYPVVPVPKLLDWREGKKLIVTESEFVDFKPLAVGEAEKSASVVRALAEIGASDFDEAAKFTKAPNFKDTQATISQRLAARDAALAEAFRKDHARWAAHIDTHPLVFCHGDLNKDNVSETRMTLDWDGAGFCQYGYDAAYTCRRRRFDDAGALLAFCANHFERPRTEARDRFAFAYFFLMLMPKRKIQWNNLTLFDSLLGQMNALADAAG
ncbi:MAG: phosphotransferase [Pararhodobacter sp.]|nr:phosphotransferase [Pararhodobacter sp.]